MNLIDLAILALLALCVAAGYYRGFLNSLLMLVSSAAAAAVALLCYPALAQSLKAAGKLIPEILNYSESADMIGSIEIFCIPVSSLDGAARTELLERLSLPYPLDTLFAQNLADARYASQGLEWFGDYLSMTIAEMAVNIGSFLIIFTGLFLLLMFTVFLVDYVAELPVLKVADGVSGAVLGFLLGAVLLFVLFMVLPVVLAFIPFDALRLMTDASQFSQLFYKANPLLGWLQAFIG